jgi:purine-cytosine permease-like protein
MLFAISVLTPLPRPHSYNLDLDLITRGSGFGYRGSIPTNVIYATFTFIFFALEGSMMAQSLELSLNMPLWAGYALATLVILPLVMYGMKVLARLQTYTSPLWLVLMVIPILYVLCDDPAEVSAFAGHAGAGSDADPTGSATPHGTVASMGVCLALMTQIAEQIDYLRLMPPRTAGNRRRWWAAMIAAGPGWIVIGALKQMAGAFLGVYLVDRVGLGAEVATQPVRQLSELYKREIPGGAALVVATLLVILSQVCKCT